jgi:hypothetical protein
MYFIQILALAVKLQVGGNGDEVGRDDTEKKNQRGGYNKKAPQALKAMRGMSYSVHDGWFRPGRYWPGRISLGLVKALQKSLGNLGEYDMEHDVGQAQRYGHVEAVADGVQD